MLDLFKVAQRIINGEQSQIPIKEHIDAWNKSFDVKLFIEEPYITEFKEVDVWLAAAAHYESFLIDMDPPVWTLQKHRFFDSPYFPSDGIRSRIIMLAETPFTFRMRLLFSGETSIKPRKNGK